ncbi:TetR/AcrR family transcriptional regulator [Amaricoccus tamworthensis]|uniref:TetR/AcrR family transcriptional regulator n=1 Tax=Amaricoccus tamworthensis TaxID=57002 RepID=UPI003C7A9FAF
MQSSEDKPICPVAVADGEMGERARKKLEQLIEGARQVFLEKGFGGASVDDIAREAGISKATMYRYFPDKSAIFNEIVRRDFKRHADMMEQGSVDLPLEELLRAHARKHVRLLTSPFMQGMFRAAVAESARVPEYGINFFESGPDKGRRWLAPVLRAAAERGEISVPDANAAAYQFFALCSAEVFYKSLFGVVKHYSEEELDEKADMAVRAFLKAYSVE